MIRFQTLGTLDLRDAEDRDIAAILSQPKRLALFAYLLLAQPRGFHRRDTLTALFWPDVSADKARASLSRAIYHLRQALGGHVVVSRGDEEVGLDADVIRCDAVMLEELVAASQWQQAADLYTGDLLAGLFVADASPELDHWLDERRNAIRQKAAQASWKVAEAAHLARDPARTVRYARQAVLLKPEDERQLRTAMGMFETLGERAAAVALYDHFVQRLAQHYDLEPAGETQECVARIRAALPAAVAAHRPAAPVVTSPGPPARASHRTRWAVAVLGIIALTAIGLRIGASDARPHVVLAVGSISVDADSLAGIRALLTTSLARLQGAEVISERRLFELAANRSVADAARAAGATDVVSGTLSVQRDGTLRMDLRRVDPRTESIRAAYTVQARSRHELVDLVTERIARDIHVAVPTDLIKGATASFAAYRFYEEALRAHYGSDPAAARQFIQAALREDSTFAMGWYFLAITAGDDDYLQRARRFAQGGSERERLLIEVEWAARRSDPHLLAFVDSLVRRYPSDPDARLRYARALITRGNAAAAIPHLMQVIRLDSAAGAALPECRTCDAFAALAHVYRSMDSIAAAERVVGQWRALMPASYKAWLSHSSLLYGMGRFTAAEAALDTAARYTDDQKAHLVEYVTVWHRLGKYEDVDRVWRDFLRTGSDDARQSAFWGQAVSYRAQGRLNEALVSAREFVRARSAKVPAELLVGERINEALVLHEMGRFREAAGIFESIATVFGDTLHSRNAAQRAWHFAHAATALAAAGDTAALRRMEDSVRVNGARTTPAHLQRLYYYVRGLRLQALHRDDEAATAFRAAIVYPDFVMARIYLELGRSLIRAGRPNEAIPVLRAALVGPVSSVGLYATQSDLKEQLGIAFERTNQADSAAVQYRDVLQAWQRADPAFAPRKRAVQRRLAALEQGARPANGGSPGR